MEHLGCLNNSWELAGLCYSRIDKLNVITCSGVNSGWVGKSKLCGFCVWWCDAVSQKKECDSYRRPKTHTHSSSTKCFAIVA